MSTPLAAGEGHFQLEQFLDLFQRGCIKFLQAEVAVWAVRIAHPANVYHLPMVPYLVEELSVHLTCGASDGFLVEHLPTLNLNNTGIILNPVLPDNGFFTPLEEPGHGVRFDAAKLGLLQVAWLLSLEQRRSVEKNLSR